MEHDGAPWADSQAQVFGLARAIDDFENVIQKAIIDLYLRNGFLHRDDVGAVH